MTSNWKEEALNEVEAVEAQVENESTAGARKRRNWPTMLLLIAIAAAVFFIYAPEPLKERVLTSVKQWLPDGQKEVTKAASKPKPAPASNPVSAPGQAPAVEQKPVVIERIVPASSEEINRVLNAMNLLQGELSSLRHQQMELEKQQHAVQVMQLRTRLNWIVNSANHLPQLQLAWEEISLMPVLSADERDQAQNMLAVAQKSLHQLQSWQQVLRKSSESLTKREHDNLIPVLENRWLNWITSQFSVRQSLSREEADDAALRDALIHTSRNIEMEIWPESRAWLELRAKLQLRLLNDNKGSEASVNNTIELPESFDTIRADIESLRSAAAVWLERL